MADPRPLPHDLSQQRTLPHSLEAERSVLGAILIDNVAYDKISSQLETRHFFRDAHRKIWDCLTALAQRHEPMDLVTLKEELEKRTVPNGNTWLEEAGGPAYVSSLVDGVPRSTNVIYYADIVREKARHVSLIGVGQKLVEAGYAATERAEDVIRLTEMRLLEVSSTAREALGAVSLAEDAGSLFREIERRIERRGQLLGPSTGFTAIDNLTHGLRRRKMIVIAGKQHYGKSVLATEIVKAAALAGQRWIYYTLEMERWEMQFRLLSSISGIPLEMIDWGTVQNFGALTNAWETVAQLPILFNDSSTLTLPQIRTECRRLKADGGLDGFVVDHVQLMDGDGDTRNDQLTDISRGLKKLCGELDCTGIVLSQLSRGDKDIMREPQPHDLRDCGAIEQDADTIIMLHPYDPKAANADNPPDVIPMKLLFRKNRGGERGVVCLNLERTMTRFVEAEPPAPVPKAAKAEKAKPEPIKSPPVW